MVVSLLTLPLTVNISEDYKVHYIQSLLLDVLADAVHGSFHVIHLRCQVFFMLAPVCFACWMSVQGMNMKTQKLLHRGNKYASVVKYHPFMTGTWQLLEKRTDPPPPPPSFYSF